MRRAANGWFERQRAARGKQLWFQALADGSPLSFAALWERWDKGEGCLEIFVEPRESCHQMNTHLGVNLVQNRLCLATST